MCEGLGTGKSGRSGTSDLVLPRQPSACAERRMMPPCGGASGWAQSPAFGNWVDPNFVISLHRSMWQAQWGTRVDEQTARPEFLINFKSIVKGRSRNITCKQDRGDSGWRFNSNCSLRSDRFCLVNVGLGGHHTSTSEGDKTGAGLPCWSPSITCATLSLSSVPSTRNLELIQQPKGSWHGGAFSEALAIASASDRRSGRCMTRKSGPGTRQTSDWQTRVMDRMHHAARDALITNNTHNHQPG